MHRFVALLVAGLMITGCQTASLDDLPPREYSFDASRARTKEALLAAFVDRGYELAKDSDLQLVVERPADDNLGAQLLYGSRFNSVPNARVLMTFLGDDPTKVSFSGKIVTNPGSGFEKATDISNAPDFRTAMSTVAATAKLGLDP